MKNKAAPIAIAIGAILTVAGFGLNHFTDATEPASKTADATASVEAAKVELTTEAVSSKYVLGKHYTELPVQFPEYEGKIVSFVWYGCHACSTVKPYIESFNESKDVVIDMHMSRDQNDFQANLFFAIEHLKRNDLHAEITDLGSSGKLSTNADYFAYLETKGLTEDAVKEAMSLESVKEAQRKSGEQFFAAGFTGTPSFIINGKYGINMGEMKAWSDIVGVLEHVYQTEMKTTK